MKKTLRPLLLLLLCLCLFLAVGCATKTPVKQTGAHQYGGGRQLTLEEIKNGDSSIFKQKKATPVKDKEARAREKLEEMLAAQLNGPPEQSPSNDSYAHNEGELIVEEEIHSPTPMATASPDTTTREELLALRKSITGVASLAEKNRHAINAVQKYSRDNRDRIGNNERIIRREHPNSGTDGVTGYAPGQAQLSAKQKAWLTEKIVKPFKAGQIRNIEITGYVDSLPTRKGAKYTLTDFSGHRAIPVRDFLATHGVVPKNVKFKKGGVTEKFGHNRRVQLDWETIGQ